MIQLHIFCPFCKLNQLFVDDWLWVVSNIYKCTKCNTLFTEHELGIRHEIGKIEQPQPNQTVITLTTDEIAILSRNNNNRSFVLALAEFLSDFFEDKYPEIADLREINT